MEAQALAWDQQCHEWLGPSLLLYSPSFLYSVLPTTFLSPFLILSPSHLPLSSPLYSPQFLKVSVCVWPHLLILRALWLPLSVSEFPSPLNRLSQMTAPVVTSVCGDR